jgi:hypothetical protein
MTSPLTAHVNCPLLLEGGPSDVSAEHAVASMPETHIRIPRQGGYEHYLYSGRHRLVDDRSLPVFHWVYRTLIAE